MAYEKWYDVPDSDGKYQVSTQYHIRNSHGRAVTVAEYPDSYKARLTLKAWDGQWARYTVSVGELLVAAKSAYDYRYIPMSADTGA